MHPPLRFSFAIPSDERVGEDGEARGKEGVSAFSSTSRTDATMAAHQHNYSSPRLALREPDEGQVLYSNARRGGASRQSREPGNGERGCRVPCGPMAEVVSSSGETRDENGRGRGPKDETEKTQKCRFELAIRVPREEITSSDLTLPSPS